MPSVDRRMAFFYPEKQGYRHHILRYYIARLVYIGANSRESITFHDSIPAPPAELTSLLLFAD